MLYMSQEREKEIYSFLKLRKSFIRNALLINCYLTENYNWYTQWRSRYWRNWSSYATLLFIREHCKSNESNGDHRPTGENQCFGRRLQVNHSKRCQ